MMKKDEFLKIITSSTPDELNEFIKLKGRSKLLDMVVPISNQEKEKLLEYQKTLLE